MTRNEKAVLEAYLAKADAERARRRGRKTYAIHLDAKSRGYEAGIRELVKALREARG